MMRNVKPVGLILRGLLLLLATSLTANVIGASLGARRGATQPRWDYSVLTVNEVYGNEKGKTTCVATICYLRSSGARCEKVEATVDGSPDRSAGVARTEALARVIGRLGDEGWEMVVGDGLGLGKEGEIKSMFFKRARH